MSSSKSFHSTGKAVNIISSSPPSPSQTAHPLYRSARQLPFELREHCLIYFEEGLYTQALNFLIALITPGNTTTRTPALLPPPQHLALACTLIVHPTFTTRAKTVEREEVSKLALRYLRLVLELVGPINGKLHNAFAFTGTGALTRSGAVHRRKTKEASSPCPVKHDEFEINNEFAGLQALWSQAHDIWQTFGWAFNCSVLHQHRWEYWGLWLEYMVQVLEKDWVTRWGEYGEDPSCEVDPRTASMIVKYLPTDFSSTGAGRRVIHALFADGNSRSVAEFPEVWKNETKERKKPSGETRHPTVKIDIEEGDYGDYDASESSELEEHSQDSATPPSSPPPEEVPDVTAALGGTRSLSLRLRLLSLLLLVSALIPDTFLPLSDLYDICLEHIRPLPLPTFFVFMSLSSLQFVTPQVASTLTQYILRSLITTAAPRANLEDLAQNVLEKCYLPFPANTQSVADNARVSLCMEALLCLLDQHVGLEWSDSLIKAIETGIEARHQKAKREGRRRKGASQAYGERMWLTASAERLRGFVELSRLS